MHRCVLVFKVKTPDESTHPTQPAAVACYLAFDFDQYVLVEELKIVFYGYSERQRASSRRRRSEVGREDFNTNYVARYSCALLSTAEVAQARLSSMAENLVEKTLKGVYRAICITTTASAAVTWAKIRKWSLLVVKLSAT